MTQSGISLFYQELIILILLLIIICGIVYFYFYRKQQKALIDFEKLKVNSFSQEAEIDTDELTELNSNVDLNTKFNSKDQQFLNNIITIIEKNIHDSEFGVEHLAAKIGLSTSQLNRKIKAITHQTTIKFIRNIKLQKAYEMLQADADNISGIAYATGFESPGYFTKVFKEHFGFLPSDKEKINEKVKYATIPTAI